MSAVLNDRDAILQAATVRIVNPKNASILLNTSAPMFHLDAAGEADVSSITVTATLVGLEGDLSFTAQGAMLTGVTGKSATVEHVNMEGLTAVVTASITTGGETFRQSCIIATVQDGADGGSGARGAGMYFATGSDWSDGIADNATPGGNVAGDVVTISNGTTYSLTKKWSGSAWVAMGAVFHGSLFVTGSIAASAIDARNLSIKDSAGNVILAANVPLAEQARVNPNLVEAIPAGVFEGNAYPWYSPTNGARDGYWVTFPANVSSRWTSRLMALKQNTKYTLSFMLTSPSAGSTIHCDLFPDTLPETLIPVKSGANKYVTTWTTGTQAELSACRLRLLVPQGGGTPQFSIWDIKFELGDKATDWSNDVIAGSNSAERIAPGAIGNTQIGGDLLSTNWAWDSVNYAAASGWLLQRSGKLYAKEVKLSGSLMGGAFTGYSWPAAGGRGYYVGPEGALFGNKNDNVWLALLANGGIESKNFNVASDGIVTINGALIVNPRLTNPTSTTDFSVSIPSIVRDNQANSATAYVTYGILGITFTNGSGQYKCQWQISVESGDVILIPSSDGTAATVKGRGSNIMALASVSVTVVDEGKNITKIAGANVRSQHGTGQIQ